MNDLRSWHNQETFWEIFEPLLFNQQRLASAPEQVEKIEKLLDIKPGARILDLPCGNGRHCLEFSERGYDVVGVDRTSRYIEAAKTKAEQRKLRAGFRVGDMREYCMPNRFDVVLNLFGSFGYFEDTDNRKVAENMYASLQPGGQFLIETMGKEILARNFQEREWSEQGDLLVLSEKKITPHWERVETRWIVIRGAERFEHHVSIRSYSAVELSSLVSACGFRDVRVYGSLDGIEYDKDAQRLVVVGRK